MLDFYGIADDDARVNPMGGAIAVGHPLASSGIRLMTYLARDFQDHPEVRYGITSMCIRMVSASFSHSVMAQKVQRNISALSELFCAARFRPSGPL